MLTRAAGPHWKADAGDELDLPLEVAAGLVSGGYAVALKVDPAPVPSETAAVDRAAERAVKPKAQPRRK